MLLQECEILGFFSKVTHLKKGLECCNWNETS
jgi:hypothetical protein